MSSRVVINTLKFCSSNQLHLEHALKLLQYSYQTTANQIITKDLTIECKAGFFYVRIASNDSQGNLAFNTINQKLTEIEALVRQHSIEQNKKEQQEAMERSEQYRIRRLKAEEELLAYQRRQLELEQQSFVEAKKAALIAKAKEKGYSVQESFEDGKIKLKLIKRVY